MRISNIVLDVCVSGLGGYKFESNDISEELILDINRYKKYIRVFLLHKQIGYVSKRDTLNVLSIIRYIKQQIRVKEWSVITKTKHALLTRINIIFMNYLLRTQMILILVAHYHYHNE